MKLVPILILLALCGCAGSNPRVIVAAHPPPVSLQQCKDDPGYNAPAPWWRWANARVHVYFVCPK